MNNIRAGLAIRVMRQLYLSGLICNPVAADRFGMVKKHSWIYGSPLIQDVLSGFHGKGQRILPGRDPDDFSAPAIGKRCLLVVDEAQYLHRKNGKTGQVGEAFEWLRATADMGKFDVAFCGDLALIGAVNVMPELQSRMLRPVIIREAGRADVAAITDGTAFATGRAIDALHRVARMKGVGCAMWR